MLEWVLQYWVGIAFGALAGFLGYMWNQFKAYRKGMIALLRNSLIKNYNDYTERKYIPIYAKEAVTSIYKSYHGLVGDDAMTNLYEELMELPSTPPRTDKTEECGNSCLKIHCPEQTSL